jgi:hypothetical protein
MAELAGKDVVIKVSGAATALVGEATTSIAGNLEYQITDVAKRVLDWDNPIAVQLKGTNDAAEAGTTTTNLTMASHGLVTGDLIVNTSRSNAVRLVTYLNANNVTVAAVTGQTTGDTIEVYKTQASNLYALNRLNGKVTFPTNTVRVIRISGDYRPMSVAAYARSMSHNRATDLLDIAVFGLEYKKRKAGLKSASGSITQIDMADTIFGDAITAGNPLVIEIRDAAASEPDRYVALLEGEDLAAAVDGLQEASVTWQSRDAWLRLGN